MLDGGIFAGGATLNLIFHITQSTDGYVTTMESVALGFVTAAETVVAGESLRLTVEEFNILYIATVSGNRISGRFTQDGQTMPDFVLTRENF